MRELTMLVKKCEDCPFYQYNYDARGDLCHYRKASPFALVRQASMIDDRCELPEAPIHVRDEYVPPVFQQSGLMASVESLPEEWFQGMTPEERDEVNRKEDERIERKIREESDDRR